MPFKVSAHHFIIGIVGIFTLIISVLLFIHPPALYPDPSWGLQVLRGMRQGGGFNMLPSPAIGDIAKNNPAFLSWWSPGQYLLPYLFILLFKVNIGHAVALTVAVCSFTGLCGWYHLFRKLGFTQLVSSVSIAFIACQQAYFIPYVFYNGGEILLFAFTGWFLYGCSFFSRTSWITVVFVFASDIIGFCCKSSFLWIFLSGIIYLWIILSRKQTLTKWITNALSIGAPAVLALAVIYIFYLSKGENPSSVALGIKFNISALTFPLASPVLAGLSIDDITNGLLYSTGPAMFGHAAAVILLTILAIISLALAIYIVKAIKITDYRLLLILFYSIAVVFFGLSFLRQANISYESRHMRIIGLLITPGLIYLISRLRIVYQVLFSVVWLYITFAGLKFWYTGYHRNAGSTAHGITGISQLFIDQQTLNYVNALDKEQHNAIFVFTSADLGLEVRTNRIITFNPINDKLVAENMNTFYGHAGPVYLVLPAAYKGVKAQVYMDHFPGYPKFTIMLTGKKYIIYSAQ